METQRKLLENKLVMPLIMNREPDSRIPWLMEVANSGILPDMVFDVIDKGKTPQEATKKAEARINKLIDQIAPTIKSA